MTLIRWEPIRELDNFFARYYPLTAQAASGPGALSAEAGAKCWAPVANISETDSEYLIRAELPEVARDDVKVTVDDSVITISGERKQSRETNEEKVHRIESNYGSFSRSFRLPEDVDLEAIKAESVNGMLKVHVPKRAVARPRTIEVRVD